MCNKCEPQSTSFLSMVAERTFLKANSPAQWAYSIQVQMKDNIRANKTNHHRFSHCFKSSLRDAVRSNKISGYQLAKLRAIALKPTNVSRVPTTILEAEASIQYLMRQSNSNNIRINNIEPKYTEARRLIDAGEWETITLNNLVSKEEPAKASHVFGIQNNIGVLHQLHVSTENPMMVAYYPSLRHAREGREVRTKLGKYLTNFMGMYQLTHSDVKDMTEKHVANMSSRGAWTVEFIEHNDKDGWRRVYNMSGVDSCMAGKGAVHVYANELSELRLAYIRDADGDLVSRCIVRDDPDDPDGNKTGWLRVYPDPNGYAEGRFMLDWLQANGYPNRTDLDGCLLTAEDGHGNNYVCPYIDSGSDGDQTVGTERVNGVTYLRVGNGEYNATNTDGYTEETSSCDSCGDSCDEDDLTYIEDVGSLCSCCRDNDYVYAYGERYQEWFSVGDCTQLGDTWYKTDCLSYHDIYYCEYSDEYMHIDDMASTAEGMINSYYAKFLDHAYEGYDYHHEGDVVELSDGTTCHSDDEEALQATIDFDTQEQDEPTNVGVSDETTGE